MTRAPDAKVCHGCDLGTPLECILDDIRAIFLALSELNRHGDDAIGSLIPMGLRKINAAQKAYDEMRDDGVSPRAAETPS